MTKTCAQGGEEQARVSLLSVVAIEKIGAGRGEQAGGIGFQAQGIDRCGQGGRG